MSEIYRVAIVGGGFSGLVAAAVLSEICGGKNVLLLEKNERVGKKILATGNGRCNLTNRDLSLCHYHSVAGVTGALNFEKYGNESMIGFFRDLGILVTEEDGKFYPASLQAGSVLDALRAELYRRDTEIKTGTKVVSLFPANGVFRLKSENGETFEAETVLLAVGGKAGPSYGTDGTAYDLAAKFGHGVTSLSPAIVQLKTESRFCKGLKGIRQKGLVSAIDGGKKLAELYGDLLFTDYGVSGNTVFYLSSYLIDAKKPCLEVDYLPDFSETEIAAFLKEKKERFPETKNEELLCGVVNKQIARMLATNFLSPKDAGRPFAPLAGAVKKCRIPVVGTTGFDQAQVTRGGIPFAEVNAETLESKKKKGLYFSGEVLDADGDCGGYNLQWAYTSARIAADGIARAVAGGRRERPWSVEK